MTADTTRATDQSLIGRSLDERYVLEAEIGVGGLGSVYRATHTKLQRPVAVKLLHENGGVHALQSRRFEREAKALAGLEHPNIVAILDYGVSDNRPYLVMELLEGETLAQRLKRGPLPLKPALSVARQLLEALAFMHGAGLVHRDVKPSNVFLQRLQSGRERVKVLDFGLAKFTAPSLPGADPTLTRDGTIVGTPAYMSPEQATGDMVDARSDVYAVGVIVFQMLSGRLPFEGDAIAQLRSHLVAPVPALARQQPDSEIEAALEALIQRAMAKHREDRFSDGRQMLQALLNLAPKSLELLLPEADAKSTALAEVDALTGDLVIALADSSGSDEIATAVRKPRVQGFAARWSTKLRHAFGTLLRAGVRVVASVSVLLVIAAIAIIALLSRNETDRADLVALQHRVSDRLIERSLPKRETSASATRQTPHDEPPTAARVETRPAAPVAPAAISGLPTAGTAAAPAQAAPPSSEAVPAQAPAATATVTDLPETPKRQAAELPAATELLQPSAARAEPARASESVPGPPEPRNPWLRVIPRELRQVHKFVSSGARVGERSVLALRAYNQQHPEDPRGHLILGQLYLSRLWRSDALAQFATALQLDLSARGAPEVLPGLLEMVRQGKVANRADKLIVRAYGSEALPTVDAAISGTKDPAAAERLRSLSARLGSKAAGF